MGELFTPGHMIVLLAVALLIFGPRKLPELGKGLGEGLRGFKDAIKGEDAKPVVSADSTTTATNAPVEPK